jgi:hypothetical protein
MIINCKKILLALILLPAMVGVGKGQPTYVDLYPEECFNAKAFYNEHQNLFEAAAKSTGLTPQLLFAIVAPELTQYGYLSNKLETYSLKVFYVQRGKAYSDFSIGYFQMKPSFIERLEETAAADANLRAKYADCLFANPDERAARVARIDRLNTLEWQLTYLSLFCEILYKRFSNLSAATTEEQLRFYASAYNCGFHKSEQQIKDMAQKALFPHFSQQKFNYSDIAVWFYRQLIN